MNLTIAILGAISIVIIITISIIAILKSRRNDTEESDEDYILWWLD